MNKDNDEYLLQSIAKKDSFAFEQLVNKYKDKIINITYRYTNNYFDSDDLAQEVFLNVWKYAPGFRYKSKFSTWLYRITINVCLNYKKKKEIHNKYFSDNYENPDDVSGKSQKNYEADAHKLLGDKAVSESIKKAMEELPPRQKAALILCIFEGNSYKEISDIMGLSLSAVESIIYRAKQGLKDILMRSRKNNEI